MFTGIITDIGRVRSVTVKGGDGGDDRGGDGAAGLQLTIETSFAMDTVAIGGSISCAGACMTVTDKGLVTPNKNQDQNQNQRSKTSWFAVDVSAESLAKTTLGAWQPGRNINLERALCLGDELGGHMVSGHVDGIAILVNMVADGDSQRLTFEMPNDLKKFITSKGSVTLDGVSLTVNEVVQDTFGVNIIPHTQTETTLGQVKVGDAVNIEIDMLARYVARLLAHD